MTPFRLIDAYYILIDFSLNSMCMRKQDKSSCLYAFCFSYALDSNRVRILQYLVFIPLERLAFFVCWCCGCVSIAFDSSHTCYHPQTVEIILFRIRQILLQIEWAVNWANTQPLTYTCTSTSELNGNHGKYAMNLVEELSTWIARVC